MDISVTDTLPLVEGIFYAWWGGYAEPVALSAELLRNSQLYRFDQQVSQN